MVQFCLSILSFFVLFLYCRMASASMPTILSNRLRITIKNGFLSKILISSHMPFQKANPQNNRNKMGLWGVIAYVVFIPFAIYIWIAEKSLWFFDPADVKNSKLVVAFLVALLSHMVCLSIDTRIKGSIDDIREDRQITLQNQKTPPFPENCYLSFHTPSKERKLARLIFQHHQKAIYDQKKHEFHYFYAGKKLRLCVDGTFIALENATPPNR